MPKLSALWKALFLSLLLPVLTSYSQKTPPLGNPEPAGAHVARPFASLYQPILDAFIKKGHPGVAALVRTREEGTWDGTAGYARLEDKTPIRPDNLFQTLSCAKAYTAAAVLMLWEQGLIDLEARIDRYLPADVVDGLPNGRTATVRHLLTHTSGIPDGDDKIPYLEAFNNPFSSALSWRDAVEKAKTLPALFPPGAGCQYRNSNYILLAMIVDQITGGHAAFIEFRIFHPLGLAHTYYKLHAGLPRPPKTVNIYWDRYGDGRLENVTDELCSIEYRMSYGNSGIVADMADCARFMEGLAGGELLGPEAWGQMTAPAFPGQEWRGSGIGIMDFSDAEGRAHRFYEMAGSSESGLAQTRTFPVEGVTIACATNVGSTNRPRAHEHFYGLMDDLAAAVFNGRAAAVVPDRWTDKYSCPAAAGKNRK